jgi:hypothetical protein
VDTSAPAVRVHRRSEPGAPAFDVTFDATPGDTLTVPSMPGFAISADEALGAV